MTNSPNPFDKPLYLDKFGLQEPPYTTNPDERYLFLTATHQEAIQMCGSLITNRQGAGLIVGEHGTGKTTIMRRLYSLMRGAEGFQTAIIETAEHSPTIFQLVKEILETFGQECVGRDTQSRMDQLKRFLADRYREQQSCVLMIDEAQQMRSALLESLRGLLNFETNTGGKLLQILLFAMPQIMPKRRYAPSLFNRLVITQLERMSYEEMADMLRWRFQQAGGSAFPFDSPTLQTLFELSTGNPRTICGIAQVALEYAGTTDKPITPEIVSEVSKRRVLN